MQIVDSKALEVTLLERLEQLPELTESGFSTRPGLTGSGVTILRGRSYFGSWRAMLGTLVWNYSNANEASYFAESVDDAVRHTMLVVLRHLEAKRRLSKAS